MPRTIITDEYRTKLLPILTAAGIYCKQSLCNTLEGILYRMRTGIPWADIPPSFGKHNSLIRAFHRWAKKGIFVKVFNILSQNKDIKWVFMDGSHVKVHQDPGASVGGADAVGRSRGGHTSKIHLLVDSCGNPIDFQITDGATNDITAAPDLLMNLDGHAVEVLTADKGYDSDAFRQAVTDKGICPDIPYRINREELNVAMDWYLYGLRHQVENAFRKLKRFRAVATRYDRLKINYESTVALACWLLWLPLCQVIVSLP